MNGLHKEVISLVADASGDATVYTKPHYGSYYPRADSCTTAGAATAGTNDIMMIVDGRIKIVLAQGGNLGAGSVTLSWIEDIV